MWTLDLVSGRQAQHVLNLESIEETYEIQIDVIKNAIYRFFCHQNWGPVLTSVYEILMHLLLESICYRAVCSVEMQKISKSQARGQTGTERNLLSPASSLASIIQAPHEARQPMYNTL